MTGRWPWTARRSWRVTVTLRPMLPVDGEERRSVVLLKARERCDAASRAVLLAARGIDYVWEHMTIKVVAE